MNTLLFLCVMGVVAIQLTAARPDLSLGYRYHQGHSSGGGDFLQTPVPQPDLSSYSPVASGNTYFQPEPQFAQANGFIRGGGSSSSGSTGLGSGNSLTSASSNTFGNFGSGSGASGAISRFDGSPRGIGISPSSSGSINGYTTGLTNAPFNNNGAINENIGSSSGLHRQVVPSSNFQNDATQFSYTGGHVENIQAPIVTKHFYLHAAPVDHDDQEIVRYVNVGRPQKNYRVVFIDAPSSTASKAKVIAQVAPIEEKTAIYVLSKKSNSLDVQTEVVTPAPTNNKPEVFFIKYKTPDEAIHAQHTIQAQYDALGGSSDVINEGTASVSSAIGSLGGRVEGASSNTFGTAKAIVEPEVNFADQTQAIGSSIAIQHTGDNTQQTYLPPPTHYHHH